jgi:hypothetical protein
MSRIALVALPMAMLLLSSCAWHFVPQKSDLQMATEAAKIAGEDDVLKSKAPQDLVPSKAVLPTNAGKSKPAAIAAPVAAPVLITTAAQPAPQQAVEDQRVAEASASTLLASVQPLASEPAVQTKPVKVKADVAGTVPANGTAIHLASYREIGSAQRGWQILSHSYHALQPLRPLYVAVEIPGKGHMLRLYGTGAATASLKSICDELHAEGAYCAANIAF